MTTAQKFWWLKDQAVAARDSEGKPIFFYDPQRLFIRDDLKENDSDKLLWIPAYWQALFGEEAKTIAHQALDIRLEGGNVIDFIFDTYQEKKGTHDSAQENPDVPAEG